MLGFCKSSPYMPKTNDFWTPRKCAAGSFRGASFRSSAYRGARTRFVCDSWLTHCNLRKRSRIQLCNISWHVSRYTRTVFQGILRLSFSWREWVSFHLSGHKKNTYAKNVIAWVIGFWRLLFSLHPKSMERMPTYRQSFSNTKRNLVVAQKIDLKCKRSG